MPRRSRSQPRHSRFKGGTITERKNRRVFGVPTPSPHDMLCRGTGVTVAFFITSAPDYSHPL